MSLLAKLIAAVEKIRLDSNLDNAEFANELETLHRHYRLREQHDITERYLADYVEKPWF